MKKILYVLTASLFIFGKCKKDDTAAAGASYLVITTGSNWTYKDSTNGGIVTYNKLTVKGTDSTINGKVYKVLTSSTGANNYWAQSGSDYYRYGILQLGAGIASTSGIEENYLKDADVNTSWTGVVPVSVQGATYNINLSYSLKEKGITKTVLGKTYTDVARVNLAFSTTVTLFGNIALGSGDFYYARGIGLISYAITGNAISIPGTSIPASYRSSDLMSYEIK